MNRKQKIMAKKGLLIGALLFALVLSFALVLGWTPYEDMDLKNNFNITNVSWFKGNISQPANEYHCFGSNC